MGERVPRPQPAGAAAGRDPAGRPAGRGQDDDRRQARAPLARERERKRVLLASTDVYRPAAILQLAAARANRSASTFAPASPRQPPVAIAAPRSRRAPPLRRADRRHRGPPARRRGDDGRGARDRARGSADETLFVVDSMAGQDAVNAARAFDAALRPDRRRAHQGRRRRARRRGALGAQVTGKPILFVGIGEKTDALEPFQPERDGLAHPRHGRRAVARSSRCTRNGRPRGGREARRARWPRARASTSRTCASSSPSSTAWAASGR